MEKDIRPVGILWDLDGVLADTGEVHYQAWVETLAGAGLPFDWESFQKTFGMNNAGMLKYLFDEWFRGKQISIDDFISQVSESKEIAFRHLIHGRVKLFPGVRQWLAWLKRMGYRQSIASSAPQENIEALVNELDIRKYFSALVSAADLPGKPDPAVFFLAAQQLQVSPSCCIVVEDSVHGVEAARRAGMRCIAVTNTHDHQALMGADLIVSSLVALSEQDFNWGKC
jgi:HAD superfamily hydrolase (TIGR01509 family)